MIFIYLFFFNSFKIISAHHDETGQSGGQKWENPDKKHLAHPQAEHGLSHMWPVRDSHPHQTQR